MGTQGIVVLLLLWIAILHPNTLAPIAQYYRGVQLVNTPHPVDLNPQPVRPIPAVKTTQEIEAPAVVVKVAPVLPRLPKVDPPPVPKIALESKLAPALATPVIPKEGVKINVFSSGSSQTPTIEKSADKVQTGGFGDPRGISGQNNNNHPITIARQGAFDLPSGPGYGNGVAGQRGTRGVTASSGFGDGTAIQSTSARLEAGIRESGFGDVQSADPAQAAAKPASTPRIKPAEIVSKPVPAYTEEARKLHIEGEVLLEVVFEGSGSVRVLRVVHGLGHGLDESAIKAAQEIRFTPAQKDGQPVDFTGVLHIVFQLA